MAHVTICGAVIEKSDFFKMETAGAVVVGSCNSFVYFFNSEGNEIGQLHADLYPFIGMMVHPTPRVWDASIKASVTLSDFPSYAECLTYSPGDRVHTFHGVGTVRGFESFDLEGQQAPDKLTDNGGRVLVELDDRTKWPCHSTSSGYYAFRSDLVKGE